MLAMSQAAVPVSAPDLALARLNMVEGQLRPNKVTDSRVLEAMGSVPREVFVPSTLAGVAYLDESVPLVAGRALMPPMVLAQLLQAAEIKAEDRVLDLAPATGYSTVVLASLADGVVGVEPNAVLHKAAEANVAKYAHSKAEILAGAPVEGCGVLAPFDVILINGGVEFVPEILFNQLSDGGRLVVVVRSYSPDHAVHTGQARLYRKTKGGISWTVLFDANVQPAPGFAAPRGFAF